jgi:hypothetical protein
MAMFSARPTRAIDPAGLPPARLQPCRLLIPPAPSLVTGGHNHDASLSGQPSQPQPRGIPARIRGLGYDSTYPFAPNPEQGWLIAIAVSTTSHSTRLTQISVHCPGIGTG